MNWIFYFLAGAAGAANPAQAGANAELRKSLGQVLVPSIAVYASGLIGIFILQLILREAWPTSSKYSGVPWWAWFGGLLSVGSTLAGMTLAQRMGSGTFTGISLTAATVSSVLLDQFGWMGFQVHHASWPRVAGCALMIGGIWLIATF